MFLIFVCFLIIGGILVVGRFYGQHLAYTAMQDRDSAIRELELEKQRLQLEKSSQTANMKTMHTEASSLQSQLDAIIPSKNRYNINPNQSLVVADGHLTIGLIGTPRADGIDININGKHQLAVVGDVVHVTADGSTACDVKIQSFDMFKAQFTASCSGPKT